MIIIIIPDVIGHLHDGVFLLLTTRILFVCPNANPEGFWESLLAILRLCFVSNCIMWMFSGTQSRYEMTQSSPKTVP